MFLRTMIRSSEKGRPTGDKRDERKGGAEEKKFELAGSLHSQKSGLTVPGEDRR